MIRSSAALASLLLLACSSEKKEPPAKAEKPAVEEKATTAAVPPAPATAPGMTRLDGLNLQIELPPGVPAHDTGGGSYAVMSGDLALTIAPTDDVSPKTVEDGKRFASAFSPTELKTETLSDGWIVQGKTKDQYLLFMRRDIAGKGIMCQTTGSKPDQIPPAIDACKSLKP